jgi:predicted Rossmann-fold nucleotide-binding protein
MGVSHELFRGGDTLIEDKIICKGDDLAERRRCLLQHADLILVLPGDEIC